MHQGGGYGRVGGPLNIPSGHPWEIINILEGDIRPVLGAPQGRAEVNEMPATPPGCPEQALRRAVAEVTFSVDLTFR